MTDDIRKILEYKRWLRGEVKKISSSLTEEYLEASSKEIAAKVIESDIFRDAKTVLCYMDFGKEVRTSAIIKKAKQDGKTVCIPLCGENFSMTAREYTSQDDLAKGAYGILEPKEASRIILPEEIDLAIIPCVSCDRRLMRIGHGAGYYDRFFENADELRVKIGKNKLYKTALCFEKVMVDKMEHEDHDTPMDAVVTEEKVYI